MDQTSSTERDNFFLLRADTLRLLVSQSEIGAIEHLDTRPEPSGLPGLLAIPGEEDTCYIVLSPDFQLIETCPDDRFVTTKLITEDGMETHWCWTEARVLMDYAPQVYELPEVLLRTDSPLRRYVLMDEQPVFLCSSHTLQHLVLGAGK